MTIIVANIFRPQAEICIPDFSTECEEETLMGKRLAEDELCFDITKTVCSMETARKNTGLGKRVVPRLCELAPPAARGSREAGFMQPRDHYLAQPCKHASRWI